MRERQCKRCNYEWKARVKQPMQCPRCKTPKWDLERNSTVESEHIFGMSESPQLRRNMTIYPEYLREKQAPSASAPSTQKSGQPINEELRKKSNGQRERTEKAIERLMLMGRTERITFTRAKPGSTTRNMTIYYDHLTDDRKQELERIDQILFDMADEVTEEGKRTLKTSESPNKEVTDGDVKG